MSIKLGETFICLHRMTLQTPFFVMFCLVIVNLRRLLLSVFYLPKVYIKTHRNNSICTEPYSQLTQLMKYNLLELPIMYPFKKILLK